MERASESDGLISIRIMRMWLHFYDDLLRRDFFVFHEKKSLWMRLIAKVIDGNLKKQTQISPVFDLRLQRFSGGWKMGNDWEKALGEIV